MSTSDRRARIAAGLFSIALAAGALTGRSAFAADAAHPVVVELFQSQGCSSCPPANANVLALAGRPDVLTLSWQVTYWDQLGWKDTFADPAFTARQWDYARAFHRGEVATPEVVVNGRADVVGNRHEEIDALIRRVDRGDGGPSVSLAHDRVILAAGPGADTGSSSSRPEVLLVRYDPNIIQVPIQRGENGGRTLPHRNVVRQVVRLGLWNGHGQSFDLPAPTRPGLKTAVLVQAGPGGAILAAATS